MCLHVLFPHGFNHLDLTFLMFFLPFYVSDFFHPLTLTFLFSKCQSSFAKKKNELNQIKGKPSSFSFVHQVAKLRNGENPYTRAFLWYNPRAFFFSSRVPCGVLKWLSFFSFFFYLIWSTDRVLSARKINLISYNYFPVFIKSGKFSFLLVFFFFW